MSERKPNAFGLTGRMREVRKLPDDGISGVPLKPRPSRSPSKPLTPTELDDAARALVYALETGVDEDAAETRQRLLVAARSSSAPAELPDVGRLAAHLTHAHTFCGQCQRFAARLTSSPENPA
jgi:hypothetical protein